MIPQNELKSKELIGSLEGAEVYRLTSVGGLNLIVKKLSTGFSILCAAPLKSIANFLAKKKFPQIELFEIAKSNHFMTEQEMVDLAAPFEKQLEEWLKE